MSTPSHLGVSRAHSLCRHFVNASWLSPSRGARRRNASGLPFVDANVVHEHFLGELSGAVRRAGPVAADRYIQYAEKGVVEDPDTACGPI